jgi:hypothetical protein
MTRPDTKVTKLHPGEPDSQSPVVSTAPVQLTPDQFFRWAELIADGQADVPPGLVNAQERELVNQVRLIRRARLVQFIARQVAQDFANDPG